MALANLITFIPECFSQLFIEGLYHEKILQLQSGDGLLQNATKKNKSEKKIVVENYFQMDQDIGQGSTRAKAIVDLLQDIVYKPRLNQIEDKGAAWIFCEWWH